MKNLYELLGDEYNLNGLIKAKELLFFHPRVTLADILDNISESDFNAQFKLICDEKFNEYKNQFISYEISDAEIKKPFIDHWIQIYNAYDSILLPLSERNKIRMAIKFLGQWTKPQLTLEELALYHYYQGDTIRSDAGRLYNRFMFYSHAINRYNFSTKLKTKYLIKRIRKIIPFLSDKAQIIANDELRTLEANYNKNL